MSSSSDPSKRTYTPQEIRESVKCLEDIFSKTQLEELEKDYYVSFNGGILSLGVKQIHVSKRTDNPER